MSSVHPLYIGEGAAAAFGQLHTAPPGEGSGTAVLMCSPFGWDDTASYRSRRALAFGLADAGYPTLRFDLPATGEAGGLPTDGDLVGTWTAAVSRAAESLRELTGCRNVTAFGLGLGGLLAVHAVAQGAPIDDLILWGTPARGRTVVRELAAFAKLVQAQIAQDDRVAAELDPSGPPMPADLEPPDGSLEVSGYVLSRETQAALSAIDLSGEAIPDATGRRALLLDRAGISVDSRLRSHLEESGVDVEVAAGPSYSAIMDHPQRRRPPLSELGTIVEWLGRDAAEGTVPEGTVPEELRTLELTVGGTVIRERPFSISRPYGEMTGVLSEPIGPARADFAAVFLNAGAIRRTGPNRMWVEATRRWAARGVPAMRLDVRGIGDSDGDEGAYEDMGELYSENLTVDVISALDGLPVQPAGGFLLSGLCSGSFWALHAAARDARVTSAVMLNLRAAIWDESLDPARDARRVRRLLRRRTGPSFKKAARGVSLSRLWSLLRFAVTSIVTAPVRRAKRRSLVRQADAAFAALRDSGKPCIFVFGQREDLYEELRDEGRLDDFAAWPNFEVRRVPGSDHQMRPLAAQKRGHAELDAALERIIGARTDNRAPAAISR
jgi:pimeloyl-ACP methyl ester carboxylesterase